MRFGPLILTAAALAFGQKGLASNAGKPVKYASVEVSYDEKSLKADNAGIRTLYIILHDADNKDPNPRPFGAIKVDLTADAKGTFYKGDLTSENVMSMPMGSPTVPKVFRLKARLDKDGNAGKDDKGDLVGSVEKANMGEQVKIVIKTKI